jgi:hypothetical protein
VDASPQFSPTAEKLTNIDIGNTTLLVNRLSPDINSTLQSLSKNVYYTGISV